MQPVITLNDILVTQGDNFKLSVERLALQPRRIYALTGPNGAGKSTLLRVMALLTAPQTGSIEFAGDEPHELARQRQKVTLVEQSPYLFKGSVEDNLSYGLRLRGIDSRERSMRIGTTLAIVGLQGFEQRQAKQLSGGESQRVALARALVLKPELLLLDEPMSALDARLRAQVQEDLRRLQRKLGRTFILVTHDQAEALVCSDRLAVMRSGRVIQIGTPEQVYDNPRDSFVAKFLGAANLIPSKRVLGGVETELGFLALDKEPPWEEGTVAIRPEWIRIGDEKPERNGIRARVSEIVYRGTNFDLWLEPGHLRVRTSSYKRVEAGREVWLELAPHELVILEDDHV